MNRRPEWNTEEETVWLQSDLWLISPTWVGKAHRDACSHKERTLYEMGNTRKKASKGLASEIWSSLGIQLALTYKRWQGQEGTSLWWMQIYQLWGWDFSMWTNIAVLLTWLEGVGYFRCTQKNGMWRHFCLVGRTGWGGTKERKKTKLASPDYLFIDMCSSEIIGKMNFC